MTIIQAIIIAIVEGLTEYLPVSSTAHMIFTSSIFKIQEDNFVKMFQVSIQFGAILSVVFVYWKKFFDFKNINFYLKLSAAVVPALVLGKLFDDEISFKSAIIIGFWQCLAMMPGTSRSAASIIGGMQQKLSRKAAAEFSFFLAVPTMLAVTTYSVFLKDWNENGVEIKGFELLFSGNNLMYFIIGNIVAFIVAVIAIKFFIEVITKYGFKPWAWYRIIMGIILLIYFSFIQ